MLPTWISFPVSLEDKQSSLKPVEPCDLSGAFRSMEGIVVCRCAGEHIGRDDGRGCS